jgi:hypothetical protein
MKGSAPDHIIALSADRLDKITSEVAYHTRMGVKQCMVPIHDLDSLIAEVRRSRQPAGGTYVEMARQLFDEMGCVADDEKCVAMIARLLESVAREEREKERERRAEIVPEQQVTANLGVYWVHEPAEIAAAIRKAQP